jgi:cysteinyl-tRNA synthetase
MGKSLGNAIYLKDLFRRYRPVTVRYFILNSHYRSPLDFTDEALAAADRGLQRLHNSVRSLVEAGANAADGEVAPEAASMVERARQAFLQAMDDDFNTAAALASLFDLARESNSLLAARSLTRREVETIHDVFRALGADVLGVVPATFEEQTRQGLEEDLIHLLIDLRAGMRRERRWAEADQVRHRLAALGVKLEDRPEGTVFRIESAG